MFGCSYILFLGMSLVVVVEVTIRGGNRGSELTFREFEELAYNKDERGGLLP